MNEIIVYSFLLKVRTPKEWRDKLDLSLCENFKIQGCIRQIVDKTLKDGIFEITYDEPEHLRDITIEKFIEETKNKNEWKESMNEEQIREIISNFWKGLSIRHKKSSKKNRNNDVFYGSDVSGTCFPTELKEWNLHNFGRNESILHKLPNKKWIEGIQRSLCYVGSMNSLFTCHSEDRNLCALSYVHVGAPKVWYGVYRGDAQKMIELGNGSIEGNDCDHLLYHKCLMISPQKLENAGIRYSLVSFCEFLKIFTNVAMIVIIYSFFLFSFKAVQEAGDMLFVWPNAYHQGLNLGFNIAEAVNFANSRWEKAHDKYIECKCK